MKSWQDDLSFECVHNIFELRQAEQKFYKLGKIYAKRWKTENWEIYVESQSSLADVRYEI